MTPPTYTTHIGKKKAYPEHCPVCGLKSLNVTLDDPTSLYGILCWFYSRPNRVYSQSVPGWNGAITWYYSCDHESPIKNLVYGSNPLLGLLPKDRDFDGRSYPLPLKVTY